MDNRSIVNRVLLSNFGFEDDDQGGKKMASTLRDAGMDVVYTGSYCTPAEIVQAAVQEDVDMLYIILSTNYKVSNSSMTNISSTLKLLKENDALDIKVIVCGTINETDKKNLKVQGVSRILSTDKSSNKIVSKIKKVVSQRRYQ